jgi:hypothetical protein
VIDAQENATLEYPGLGLGESSNVVCDQTRNTVAEGTCPGCSHTQCIVQSLCCVGLFCALVHECPAFTLCLLARPDREP